MVLPVHFGKNAVKKTAEEIKEEEERKARKSKEIEIGNNYSGREVTGRRGQFEYEASGGRVASDQRRVIPKAFGRGRASVGNPGVRGTAVGNPGVARGRGRLESGTPARPGRTDFDEAFREVKEPLRWEGRPYQQESVFFDFELSETMERKAGLGRVEPWKICNAEAHGIEFSGRQQSEQVTLAEERAGLFPVQKEGDDRKGMGRGVGRGGAQRGNEVGRMDKNERGGEEMAFARSEVERDGFTRELDGRGGFTRIEDERGDLLRGGNERGEVFGSDGLKRIGLGRGGTDRGGLGRGVVDRGILGRGRVDRVGLGRGGVDREILGRGGADREILGRGGADRGGLGRGGVDRGGLGRGGADRGILGGGGVDRGGLGRGVADISFERGGIEKDEWGGSERDGRGMTGRGRGRGGSERGWDGAEKRGLGRGGSEHDGFGRGRAERGGRGRGGSERGWDGAERGLGRGGADRGGLGRGVADTGFERGGIEKDERGGSERDGRGMTGRGRGKGGPERGWDGAEKGGLGRGASERGGLGWGGAERGGFGRGGAERSGRGGRGVSGAQMGCVLKSEAERQGFGNDGDGSGSNFRANVERGFREEMEGCLERDRSETESWAWTAQDMDSGDNAGNCGGVDGSRMKRGAGPGGRAGLGNREGRGGRWTGGKWESEQFASETESFDYPGGYGSQGVWDAQAGSDEPLSSGSLCTFERARPEQPPNRGRGSGTSFSQAWEDDSQRRGGVEGWQESLRGGTVVGQDAGRGGFARGREGWSSRGQVNRGRPGPSLMRARGGASGQGRVNPGRGAEQVSDFSSGQGQAAVKQGDYSGHSWTEALGAQWRHEAGRARAGHVTSQGRGTPHGRGRGGSEAYHQPAQGYTPGYF